MLVISASPLMNSVWSKEDTWVEESRLQLCWCLRQKAQEGVQLGMQDQVPRSRGKAVSVVAGSVRSVWTWSIPIAYGREVHRIRKELGIEKEELVYSNIWIWGFYKRHDITSWRITHHSLEDRHDTLSIKSMVEPVQLCTADLDSVHIFNMNETPVYVDKTGDSTVNFKAARSVEALQDRCSSTLGN